MGCRSISDANSYFLKWGPTAFAAALITTIPSSAWCSGKALERVSLVYRNDNGINARILSCV